MCSCVRVLRLNAIHYSDFQWTVDCGPSTAFPTFGAMKKIIVIGLLALTACGGSLSDEQRKKIREDMALHEIKKVTEVEITEAALERGRSIMATIEKLKDNSSAIDSLASATKTKITWVVPGKSNAGEIEQQLIDAYIAGAATGSLQDNLQKIRHGEDGPDSLLYTKPVVKNLTDGSVVVEGAWNIYISQKELILSMGSKK